jgi:hypothetical protein
MLSAPAGGAGVFTYPGEYMPHALTEAPQNIMSPNAGMNEADALGVVTRRSLASSIYDAHRAALQARRSRDLISEKLFLHIDGSGDFQWADIFFGERVEIPRDISEWRKTENLLRIVVDNAVAHHTTTPLHYFVESTPDRAAREQATIDMLWANNLASEQDFNALFAEALYLAMPAGFCPVHAYWRDDVDQSHYEPVQNGPDLTIPPDQLPAGMIDCFVGNPFGTTYNRGATRSSVQWCTYERLLSADRVREHFGHIPGVMGLEGTQRIAGASMFQRIAKDWALQGLAAHGDPTIRHRRHTEGDEELIMVLCREEAPGPHNQMEGRLQMVALPGSVDVRGGGERSAAAVMLADQPLPGADFSWTNVYSHHRSNDVLGKPWVEDLDQAQIDLNIALSKRWEHVVKQAEAPIVTPGGAIEEDMGDFGGYGLMELDPTLGTWRPRVMEWPQAVLTALDKEVADKRSAIYTIGGYQAASRGESLGSRTPYRAILALQQADNSIHGPVNQRFQRAATDFMRRCHSQFRMYGDVPVLIQALGDEYAHNASEYIDKTKVSNVAPRYKLVNSFGSSPELHGQEIIELVQLRGADGIPFLTTAEARKQYPNSMLFDSSDSAAIVKKRRARTIASKIRELVWEFREQNGFMETDPTNPMMPQAAYQIFQQIEAYYPRRREDDLEAHVDAYSAITQDETEDPLVRSVTEIRLNLYYEWQMAMAQQSMAPAEGGAAQAASSDTRSDGRQVAAEMAGGEEL